MKPEPLLKAVVAFIGVYHLVIGAGLMFSERFQRFAVSTYGASFDWNVRDTYFIRIVGSFVFVLGSLALAASVNPVRYALILLCYMEFFLLRDIHRHLYSAELYEGFGVSPAVNVATSVVFAIQAIALGWLLWKCRASRAEPPPS